MNLLLFSFRYGCFRNLYKTLCRHFSYHMAFKCFCLYFRTYYKTRNTRTRDNRTRYTQEQQNTREQQNTKHRRNSGTPEQQNNGMPRNTSGTPQIPTERQRNTSQTPRNNGTIENEE